MLHGVVQQEYPQNGGLGVKYGWDQMKVIKSAIFLAY